MGLNLDWQSLLVDILPDARVLAVSSPLPEEGDIQKRAWALVEHLHGSYIDGSHESKVH